MFRTEATCSNGHNVLLRAAQQADRSILLADLCSNIASNTHCSECTNVPVNVS